MMAPKTILTCAVTGNITTREQHPRLPVTPQEIATAALEAADAGAAIVHLHARDPETGQGSMRVDLFREIHDRIRDKNTSVIINFSTGEGGRFVPDVHIPSQAAEGTTLTDPLTRVAHISEIRPDISTLDLNTMYSGTAVVINTPENIRKMAQVILESGTLPEIELFDGGDLQLLKTLLADEILRSPPWVQFVMGVRYGMAATAETLPYFVSQLPPNTQWGAFGVGRHAFRILAQAYLLGGHVRTGLEDTIFIEKGRLARDNAELVEKGAHIIEQLGGSLASPEEARSMLGLSG
ncbi:MAG: 3-keto-5-aminohexanoate cleavage protein [Pseudomonadota bacterium]